MRLYKIRYLIFINHDNRQFFHSFTFRFNQFRLGEKPTCVRKYRVSAVSGESRNLHIRLLLIHCVDNNSLQ